MQNKDVALRVSKAILQGQWDVLDGLLADDFTYTGDGMHFDKRQYIDFMKSMKSAFSNMAMEFTHVVSEDDAGEHPLCDHVHPQRKVHGRSATNKPLAISGIFLRKISPETGWCRSGRRLTCWAQ